MFEKSKIRSILASYPKAEAAERKGFIERLNTFGDMCLPLLADQVRSRVMLFADALEISTGLYSKDRLAAFISGLADPMEPVRELFIQTIRNEGKPAIAPSLVESLTDNDLLVRSNIAKLLIELGGVAMAPKILPLLQSRSVDVKKTVIELLGELKAENTAVALAPLLDDPDSYIRRKCAEALHLLKDKAVLPQLRAAAQKHNDPAMMKVIIETIGDIGGPEDGIALLKLVQSQNMVVRNMAVDAIIKVADSTLAPEVVKILGHEDVNIRRSAVDILNGLKDRKTAAALIQALKDGDWWVREIATEALSDLGGGKISGMILGLLFDEDVNVRRSAVEFYCKVKEERAYRYLIKLLKDKDWWVREKSVTALGVIGSPEAIPDIIALHNDTEVKWAIAPALTAIGTDAAAKALKTLLSDDQRGIRLEALKALSQIEGAESLESIKYAARDKDPEVQSAALVTLRKITGKVWMADDFIEEEKTTTGSSLIISRNCNPGDILTEAIMVVDVYKSTNIAATYGDSAAYKMLSDLGEIIIPLAQMRNLAFSKGTGDGFLMTFNSVDDAVYVATETLKKTAERNSRTDKKIWLILRFAIHLGETRVDNNLDRIGLAVNMTFRIEGVRGHGVKMGEGVKVDLPEENRIVLSETAHNQIADEEGDRSLLLGYFELKGISGLHPVYYLDQSGSVNRG